MGNPIPPFEVKSLARPWIHGISGAAFRQRVKRRIDSLSTSPDAARRGVLIVERDPIAFAAAFFAAVWLRVPVILANPRWGRLEWQEVAACVNPALVYGSAPLTLERRRGVRSLHPGDILIPTGGSSGGVKFAVHDWRSLSASWHGLQAFIGPGPYDACCVLPLYHVSGLMQLVRAFLSGGRIAFPDFNELQQGKFPFAHAGGACLSLVTTQLQRLMTQKRVIAKLMSLRAIFVGGGPMPVSVAVQARAFRLPVIMSYGMTETAAMIAAMPPDEFLSGLATAGRPLQHARIDVLCESGQVCPVGASGRIRISGDSLFKGYRGSLDGVQADGTYLTDDEGYFDASGRLHVIGRMDRLIISGGEKIDPREVEEAIRNTGAVKEVLVVGWPDEEWGQTLIALYTTGGVASDARKWGQEIRAELAHYKVPKQMIQVPRLPLNERGKVDRQWIERILNQTLELTD